MSGDDKHFDANKIFYALFAFTAIEVAWGYAGSARYGDWNKMMLWGGLLFFAFLKGWLIAIYFMHLKFEGWVVKSLILPTPFLIMVIMGYVVSDVSNHDAPIDHPIGSMLDPETGVVHEDLRDIWSLEGAASHGTEATPVADEGGESAE
jgi:caa(3)-type oxidase subunit IV